MKRIHLTLALLSLCLGVSCASDKESGPQDRTSTVLKFVGEYSSTIVNDIRVFKFDEQGYLMEDIVMDLLPESLGKKAYESLWYLPVSGDTEKITIDYLVLINTKGSTVLLPENLTVGKTTKKELILYINPQSRATNTIPVGGNKMTSDYVVDIYLVDIRQVISVGDWYYRENETEL